MKKLYSSEINYYYNQMMILMITVIIIRREGGQCRAGQRVWVLLPSDCPWWCQRCMCGSGCRSSPGVCSAATRPASPARRHTPGRAAPGSRCPWAAAAPHRKTVRTSGGHQTKQKLTQYSHSSVRPVRVSWWNQSTRSTRFRFRIFSPSGSEQPTTTQLSWTHLDPAVSVILHLQV